MMKILFIGSTKRGYLTLKALLESGSRVVGLISLEQMPSEAERYEEKFRELANLYKLPFFESKNLKERDYAKLIFSEISPDLTIVVGCRILLPQGLVDIPVKGTLAVHDSFLPAYRGFAPLNWAMINGESSTGVTLFYLSDLMDAGDIVSQVPIPISAKEYAGELYEKVCAATVEMVLQSCPLLENGIAPRLKQESRFATYTCSRTPEDGLINWAKGTQEIFNLIRGTSDPFPGAFTFFDKKKMIIWQAEPIENSPFYVGRIPGRVIQRDEKSGSIDVLTGDGILRLLKVQIEHAEVTPPSVIIKSVRLRLGS